MAAPRVPGWQGTILSDLGAPVTPENLLFMNDWSRAEGGGADNNPFNTTQPGYHEIGNYNSVGVKRYGDPNSGIQATVHTLQNGRYGNILAALRKGDSAVAAAQALANSPWGTGALVLKMLGSHTTPSPGGGLTSKDLAQASLSAPPVAPQQDTSRQALLGMLSNNLAAYANTGVMGTQQVDPSALVRAQAPVPSAKNVPVAGSPTGGGIAKTALTQLGKAYKWGGAAVLGGNTDCSGLLQASARANGINIGRTTYQQFKQGTPVPLNQLKPGDAVFSEPGPNGPGHVSIYIGNGHVVEDPHTGSSVHISTLAGRTLVGARRY